MLDPSEKLAELEHNERVGQKLALMEATKTLPLGAVRDRLCQCAGVPAGGGWVPEVEAYERDVLTQRG